ncbi:MAG TPA: glycosyl hydrolase family 17 protein [Burkholderiales bacterium]|nr:glycosyl hydrolase family 17 protein [Burkholderiales bacterium]
MPIPFDRFGAAPIKRAAVLALAAVGAAASVAWWTAGAGPVAVVDAPAERLPCVSYTPFRTPGQSPLVTGARASVVQMDADLAALARLTRCVRTYSVDEGLDEVPRLARKHGLRVLLGIWIGRDAAENEREIANALEVLKRHGDVIDGVIVGNEVLLRREQSVARLRAYIERVRAATATPVTYADVWEFWLRNAELAGAVSFVTVHMLPYWEDDPQPIGRAVDHVLRVHERVRAAFPGKAVLIGEVGWPSEGRRRENAVPSLTNQARFVREFADAAARHGMRYNVIEAFDQPWKRWLEGTVGGTWGLLDADARPKFPLQGPVPPARDAASGMLAMALGAVGLFAIGIVRAPRVRLRGGLFLVLAGSPIGTAILAQTHAVQIACRNAAECSIGAGFSVLGLVAAMLCAVAIARRLDGGNAVVPAPVVEIARWLKTDASVWSTPERVLGALRFALLFGAGFVALGLAFDPRYRGFPFAAFAAPAAGFAALAWLSEPAARAASGGREERVLAAVLAACAPVIVWRETLANVDALAWAGLCLLLAASAGLPVARARERDQPEQECDRAGLDRVQHESSHPETNRRERQT